MALATYTTPDEIRAVLGVSDEELADAVILLPTYDKALRLDLYAVDSGLETLYTSKKGSALPADEMFLTLTDLFATYSVAKHLTESLPNFAPRTISDGKASMQRQLNPEELVIRAVREGYQKYRTQLLAAVASFTATTISSAAPVFMVTARGVDPVTGA